MMTAKRQPSAMKCSGFSRINRPMAIYTNDVLVAWLRSNNSG